MTNPRTLIFSQRNIFSKALWRAPHFEFEDIICQIDSAEILAPQFDPSCRLHNFVKRIGFHAPIMLNPGLRGVRLDQNYDLFLAVCALPTDLLMINALGNWRRKCKFSVCLMDEIWITEMDIYGYFLQLLDKFDLILLYYSQSVNALSERIGRKCAYLPPGVDTILFCPYPELAPKVIDVYSIGRRSERTHRTLLRMAAENHLFYLHDSIGGEAINLPEHRSLIARVAKRSRYFIVNPGLIDRPDVRGNQLEIGNRYFEGAAAGTIMIGERPDNGEFKKHFDWPDALIHLPYDSTDIDIIIESLDRQTERQDAIHRTNVVQALQRHDWVYRWEVILRMAGLEPMPELFQRKERLALLADSVQRDDAGAVKAQTT